MVKKSGNIFSNIAAKSKTQQQQSTTIVDMKYEIMFDRQEKPLNQSNKQKKCKQLKEEGELEQL
ncbi:hypothetical protein DERP_004996 [Dermatophagoides pteronyssinus]|uniref:Uncharacterized protein n=1 Tax=Dermatophagoides pteronyssinus TaxID=6956 RepID=A0ABQ8JTQ1_DERPT|nr:hypothetical protein DERP_004996 [Dermatophagoides pteronyssinus]